MNTGKILKNAGSHRILYALSVGPRTSKELKVVAGAIYSIAKFDGEYMDRLAQSGYIQRQGDGWILLHKGQLKLEELGPASGMRLKANKLLPVLQRPVYVPEPDLTSQRRPGAEDFLKCPSRIGNTLYYRDGTVKHLEN